MSFQPSIGDCMMLSSLAWKIGRAFTAGRAGAPAELQAVETELESLTIALRELADLEGDKSVMQRADSRSLDGLRKIIGSCKLSLEDLESFIDHYQVIRRTEGSGGFAVEKQWRTSVLKNYKTIMWTTEGGNIQSLRNKLAVHTQSLNLILQAMNRYEHSI